MSSDEFDVMPDHDEEAGAGRASDPAEGDAADTKPKAPPGLHEAVTAAAGAVPPPVLPRFAAEALPARSLDDTDEIVPVVPQAPARVVLLALVMVGMVCLCAMLVGLAGFAGYRDGLATNDVRITRTLATGIAEQYASGVGDLQRGNAALAEARFAWIVETIQPAPEYLRDSPQLLAMARTMQAYTPTPQPTASVTPSPSASPTLAPAPATEATTVPDAQNPDVLYKEADNAMRVRHYEDAIEWIESLRALAPDYRAAEVTAMYMEALTEQGKIYLRQQNEDGADMLARGVTLIYMASDLGPVEPPELYGEAIFAENYVNARSYVNGGNYAAAIPILEDLCNANCGWSYHGLSVQNLLEQAQTGAGSAP